MMLTAVMHINTSTAGSTSPTMRIAKFVAEELDVPLIHNFETARKYHKTKFDILFVKHGLLKFSDHREHALEIYDNAKLTVNLENDYTFKLDPRFRPADETWSTVQGKTRYVNWNVLTRQPLNLWKHKIKFKEPHNDGLIYYGAARADRLDSFKQYFKAAPYPITISTFRGRAKFTELCGDKIKVIGAFRNPTEPLNWPATLYLEDKTSHTLYCSPAARFYECLQMGLAQLIDEAAVDTFKQANLAVPLSFVVASQRSVKDALHHWRDIREEQHRLWWRDYARQLRDQFWDAMLQSFRRKKS